MIPTSCHSPSINASPAAAVKIAPAHFERRLGVSIRRPKSHPMRSGAIIAFGPISSMIFSRPAFFSVERKFHRRKICRKSITRHDNTRAHSQVIAIIDHCG